MRFTEEHGYLAEVVDLSELLTMIARVSASNANILKALVEVVSDRKPEAIALIRESALEISENNKFINSYNIQIEELINANKS